LSLLGIDIGTSSCKGAVFDCNGDILAKCCEEYSSYSPQPGMVEMDANVFWNAFVKIIKYLSEATVNNKIEALSICSHGESFVPIDKRGNAIGPVLMNQDNRALKQTELLEKRIGKKKIYEKTGMPPHAMYSINKIIWIKENLPDLFDITDKFVSIKDYILIKMGLPPYTDYSTASRTMAFNIKEKEWSREILDYAGINKDKMSIPIPSGERVGKISLKMSRILGLSDGVIIAAGGHDQPCGTLGSGSINSGDISDSAGTYECLSAVSNTPLNNEVALKYNINSYCHVIPDRYVTLAFFPAGIVTKWFTEQFCYEEKQNALNLGKSFFDLIDEKTKEECSGPTGLYITPHFTGSCNPYWDVRATGIIAGLTPAVTKYHIYKAIYEGIAFELAINVNVLEKVTGTINNIKIYGGNSNSEFTIQLRSDITGKEIFKLGTSETVCLGAAMLAGISAKVYSNENDAINNLIKPSIRFKPDIKMKSNYLNQIDKYTLLYSSLESFRKK